MPFSMIRDSGRTRIRVRLAGVFVLLQMLSSVGMIYFEVRDAWYFESVKRCCKIRPTRGTRALDQQLSLIVPELWHALRCEMIPIVWLPDSCPHIAFKMETNLKKQLFS